MSKTREQWSSQQEGWVMWPYKYITVKKRKERQKNKRKIGASPQECNKYPLLSVLVHGRVRWAHDAEPSIPARGWLGQSYVRCATSGARSSHALLSRHPRRPHVHFVTWWVTYRAMATIARLPRQPHLPQAFLVTLQPPICAYKATYQLGGQLPFYHTTDVITHSQHRGPQWRQPVGINLGVLGLNSIHADPCASWWQWAVTQLGNIGSHLLKRVVL